MKIEGGTFSITEALVKGLDTNSEYNDPAVAVDVGDAVHDIEIMNPGRLGRDKLDCSRKDSVSDLVVEFHATDRCFLDGAQGCVCRIKRGSGLDTDASTSATLELRVSAVTPGGSLVVQDMQTVVLSWEAGTTIPEPGNHADGNGGNGGGCGNGGGDGNGGCAGSNSNAGIGNGEGGYGEDGYGVDFAVDDDWTSSWLNPSGSLQNGGQKVSTGIIIAVALGAAIFIGILVAVVVQ